jgi:hypothetical protein
MNVHMILKLIKSTKKDDEVIAATLYAWCKENPNLFNLTFPEYSNGSLFHVLVLYQKSLVIQSLLENPNFRAVLMKTNHDGQTALHLAAQDVRYRPSLEALLKHATMEVVNFQDSLKNTALHIASKREQIWAVSLLIKTGHVIRNLTNNKGKTAFQLTANPEVKKILMGSDLTSIASFSQRLALSPPQLFHDSFPQLSSRSNNGSFSSAENSLNERRLMKWDSCLRSEILDLGEGAYRENLELGEAHKKRDLELLQVDVLSIQSDFKSLLQAHQNDSLYYKGLLNQFLTLFARVDLNAWPELQGVILPPLKLEENIQVLNAIISHLANEIRQRVEEIEKEHLEQSEMLLSTLLRSGYDGNQILIKPYFENNKNAKTLTFLWEIIAGVTSKNKIRKINLDSILKKVIGLPDIQSFAELLAYLIELYPYYDYHQKLVANYIVYQLIAYNAHALDVEFREVSNEAVGDQAAAINNSGYTTIRKLLQQFMQCNTDEEMGLEEMGATLSDSINTLVRRYDEKIYGRAQIRNYALLYGISQNLKYYEPFDSLVDRALSANKEIRSELVECIAEELRMLYAGFFQRVAINEFRHFKISKVDKDRLAYNVIEFTEWFNSLSNYFQCKILDQPKNNIANVLKLLLEIGIALCSLNEGYSNLHHLMMITSALESKNISRLKPYIDALPAEEKRILAEFQKMIDPRRNKLWLRMLYNSKLKTFPYLGLFMADLDAAYNAEEEHHKAETVGDIIHKLMNIKRLLQFYVVNHKTNLPFFLQNYTLTVTDDELYSKSLQICPMKEGKLILDLNELEKAWENAPIEKRELKKIPLSASEILQFDKKLLGLWLKMNELQTFLNQGIIPETIYQEKQYLIKSLRTIVVPLTACLADQLKTLGAGETDPQKKVLFFTVLTKRLSIVLNEFIKKYNEHSSSQLNQKLNPYYAASRIMEIRKQLQQIQGCEKKGIKQIPEPEKKRMQRIQVHEKSEKQMKDPKGKAGPHRLPEKAVNEGNKRGGEKAHRFNSTYPRRSSQKTTLFTLFSPTLSEITAAQAAMQRKKGKKKAELLFPNL